MAKKTKRWLKKDKEKCGCRLNKCPKDIFINGWMLDDGATNCYDFNILKDEFIEYWKKAEKCKNWTEKHENIVNVFWKELDKYENDDCFECGNFDEYDNLNEAHEDIFQLGLKLEKLDENENIKKK